MNETQAPWPSAVVAISILALIGAVTVTAIVRYPTLEEALQIWQAMAALIGLVTGAFVTYFFTRASVETAQTQARDARELATEEGHRAYTTRQALTQAVGLLPPDEFEKLLRDPAYRVAMSLAGDQTGNGRMRTSIQGSAPGVS